MNSTSLAVVLACFPEAGEAGQARRTIDAQLGSIGVPVLDAVILSVDRRHRAHVHDPRRVVAGTWVPALTWGVFALLAGGWVSALVWAPIGVICGFFYTYYGVHHASKAELATIGRVLPAESSALVLFVATSDPDRVLSVVGGSSPTTASIAGISADLSVAGAAWSSGAVVPEPQAVDAETKHALASMILVRYRRPDGAHEAALRVKRDKAAAAAGQVELVVRTDASGRRHVADPTLGVAATAQTDIWGWGVFGLVVGAISGIVDGGILRAGLVTGLVWALFGILAGALFGLFAGRSVSARRLRRLSPVLAEGSSAILAWTAGQPPGPVLDALTDLASEHAIVSFIPSPAGAVVRDGGT